jgi:hypothetical protein
LSLGKGDNNVGLGVVPALEKLLAGNGIVVITDEPKLNEFLQPTAFSETLMSRVTKFSDVKADLATAFAKAGIKPWVAISGSETKLKKINATLHTISGPTEGQLLTILRAPVGQKDVIGADGVIHTEPDAEGGREIERINIDISGLGGQKVFYDIRNQRRLEVTKEKITIDMLHGSGYPIAILPYEVDGIVAKASVNDRLLSVKWALTSAAKAFTRHVIRVEVLNSKSHLPIPYFCENVLCDDNGKGRFALPLALEDSGRDMTVRVRDVLSGKEARVDVKN